MAVSASAKTVIDSFREAVQDLLVPELKALRVSVDSVKTEMHLRDENLQGAIDALRTEMQLRGNNLQESIDAVKSEMQLRIDGLRSENQVATRATQEAIQNLAQKLDFAINIREPLAALEARLPRQ